MMGIGRIANTKRVTFSEDGCMSIELVWVVVWVNLELINIISCILLIFCIYCFPVE